MSSVRARNQRRGELVRERGESGHRSADESLNEKSLAELSAELSEERMKLFAGDSAGRKMDGRGGWSAGAGREEDVVWDRRTGCEEVGGAALNRGRQSAGG